MDGCFFWRECRVGTWEKSSWGGGCMGLPYPLGAGGGGAAFVGPPSPVKVNISNHNAHGFEALTECECPFD